MEVAVVWIFSTILCQRVKLSLEHERLIMRGSSQCCTRVWSQDRVNEKYMQVVSAFLRDCPVT
ncbi:hypothetical protein CSUI_008102 [Cystoisospora suis]|uniref:Uncharacterized protein n=1 Tax=Cystoisospora suis TaxID=483139 RepID=A0A2C6KNX3_9APIC|nr:hypothetical protein CSUI_008102 [Cystoisospora suis]